jgi:hypothetical protein
MAHYKKTSLASTSEEIQNELVNLIIQHLNQKKIQNELLLWINETNSYVSCHWYDSEKETIDESENYSVVEFEGLIEGESFYNIIVNSLESLPINLFQNQITENVIIYESDETNEHSKIFEIENGELKVTESSKNKWENGLLTEIEKQEFLTPEFKKRKIILWILRTIIAIVLYIIFWNYNWVKWSLAIYIPLNLFSILSIFFWRNSVKNKLDKIKSEIK